MLPERFMNKVVIESSGCWRWAAATRKGYGVFRTGSLKTGDRKLADAHRFAWETVNGPIADGLEIDHLCRNPLCVNPSHLEAVSPRENKHRSDGWAGINARKDACIRGHALSGDNLLIRPDGHRRCRECVIVTKRIREARAAVLAPTGDDRG